MIRYYQYKSPFVFNEPFTIEKKEGFFGREKKINEISKFFNRTNLLIIYGPVGSGKSSIAQCGLAKQFLDWKPHTVYRNGGFVQSFSNCLRKDIAGIDVNVVENFFKKIHEYRREQRRIETFREKIGRYYEKIRLDKNHKETKNERDIFKRNRIEISKLRKSQEEILAKIYEDIEVLQRSCPYKPVFVFDQFEDLFIEGEVEEIELMKIILSVLKKAIDFSKNILCIQDDLFSNLLEFEKSIPNLLKDSVSVNYVADDELYDIIQKNFEYYNINQIYVPKQTPPQIPEKDSRNRIKLIIEQLKKNDKVHLPFLQLYLNRLYVEDFDRSYKEDLDDLKKVQTQQYFYNKPLEFTRHEIRTYGNIEKVLGIYIKEINDRLVEKENQITSRKGYRDVTLKFLKYFVNENGMSKSLKIGLTVDSRENRDSEKFLNLKNKDLKNKIKMDIWKSTEDFYEQSIGDLIKELLESRILVKRKYYIELSHNLLASVIRDIPIMEDMVDFHGREFNASFDTFKRQTEGKNAKLFFLRSTPSKRVFKIVSEEFDNVVSKTDPERNLKISFLKKIKYTFWLRNLAWLMLGFLILSVGAWSYVKSEIKDQKLLNMSIKTNVELQTRRDILIKLDETSSLAEFDVTQAYKNLVKYKKEVKDSPLSLSDFPSIEQNLHSYLSNYTSNSFYSNSSIISKSNRKYISQFKLPALWDSQNRAAEQKGYYLSSNNLYRINLNMENLSIAVPKLVQRKIDDNAISGFEPFFSDSTNQEVIVSDSKGVKIIKSNSGVIVSDSTNSMFKKLREIEHLRTKNKYKVFVGVQKHRSNKDKLVKISFRNDIQGREIELNYLSDSYLVMINDSVVNKTVDDFEIKYVARKDSDEICFIAALNQLPYIVRMQIGDGGGSTDKILDTMSLKRISKNISINDITAFSINDDKEVGFMAIENIVYPFDLDQFFVKGKQFRPAVMLPTGSKVTSISSDKDKLLISSENKLVYLYSFNESNTKIIGSTHILKKELRGHYDAVSNALLVSTNEVDKLKGVSTGEDGRMLLWDLEPLESKEDKIPEGLDLFDLKYITIDGTGSLFVGFNFIEPTKAGNYLLKFDKNLDSSIDVPYKKNPTKNSNLNTIDVDENGKIYVGTFWNGLFGPLDEKPISVKEILNDKKNRRINKLRIFDGSLAIASDKGIIYCKDKNDLNLEPRILLDSINFNTVEFYPDVNRRIIIGSSDNGNIYLYNLDNECIRILDNHSDRVRDATFSKNGKYFVSGSWDNSAIMWKTIDIEELMFSAEHTIRDSKSDIEDVSFNEESTFALASSDNHVYIYDIVNTDDTYQRVPSFVAHRFPVRAITFDDENNIFTIDKLGNVKKWNYRNAVDEINDRIKNVN